MSYTDFTLIMIWWIVMGALYLKFFGINTASSILLVKSAGYPNYARLMMFFCLLLWPLSTIISTLMLMAYMKYKGIPIPKNKD